MAEFKLKAEKIHQNWEDLLKIIQSTFSGERKKRLLKMYKALEDEMVFLPASTYSYFHNAIPGGYVDHVLRVIENSKKVYKLWKDSGLYVDNFTKEELIFVALNHDLGKVGFSGEGNEGYVQETEKWWRDNRQRMYKTNPTIPYAKIQHRSLFLLQEYDIPSTWNEWQGIMIHDGMFDEENQSYFKSFKMDNKLRCNLPRIVHHADIMAAQFELERWNKHSKKIKLTRIDKAISGEISELQQEENSKPEVEENDELDFNKVFK